MSSSVNAISTSLSSGAGFGGIGGNTDSEYEQIKKKLEAYGIKPTGNKAVDKAKLEEVEARVKQMQAEAVKKNTNVQRQQEAAASSMTGAQNLSELNKLMFGLA